MSDFEFGTGATLEEPFDFAPEEMQHEEQQDPALKELQRIIDEREQQEATKGEAYTLKTCPRCGATLFADMDTCYGCLYDFALKPASAPVLESASMPMRASARASANSGVVPQKTPREKHAHVEARRASLASRKSEQTRAVSFRVGDTLEINACGLTINICASGAQD